MASLGEAVAQFERHGWARASVSVCVRRTGGPETKMVIYKRTQLHTIPHCLLPKANKYAKEIPTPGASTISWRAGIS